MILELTDKEYAMVRGLVGLTTGDIGTRLYRVMSDQMQALNMPPAKLVCSDQNTGETIKFPAFRVDID